MAPARRPRLGNDQEWGLQSGWKPVNNLQGLVKGDSTPTSLLAGKDGYLTLDFGKPVRDLRLDVEAVSPGTILDFAYCGIPLNLKTGERVLLEDGSFDPEVTIGTPAAARMILHGPGRVELLEERTLRWLMITWRNAKSPVSLLQVSIQTSQQPLTQIGSFEGGSG